MSSVGKEGKIWMNGKIVAKEDAKVSVLTHTLHYGVGVFEGIRCYKVDNGSAVFRLKEHIQRLLDSARIFMIDPGYSIDELCKATVETVKANNLEECYIRPIIYLGDGGLGIKIDEKYPVETAIAAWNWGAYLGEEGMSKGIKVCTSSFNRFHVNSTATRSKTCGNYVSSVLAKREAILGGYDEALFLDTEGYVAEGSGENVFVIKNGKLITTPMTSILRGITRDSIMTLAKDLGYEVVEQKFTKDDFYLADEAFFTGTAAEVTPISQLDGRKIGTGVRGEITTKLQSAFFDIVKGNNKKYSDWLYPVK